jgi:hypothetical protein
MKFASATKFDRKSGVVEGRNLQFPFPTQRKCGGLLDSGFVFSINGNCRSLPCAAVGMTKGGGPPWHEWRWMARSATTTVFH